MSDEWIKKIIQRGLVKSSKDPGRREGPGMGRLHLKKAFNIVQRKLDGNVTRTSLLLLLLAAPLIGGVATADIIRLQPALLWASSYVAPIAIRYRLTMSIHLCLVFLCFFVHMTPSLVFVFRRILGLVSSRAQTNSVSFSCSFL